MCPQLLSEQASKIDGIALSLLIWPFVSTFQWPVTLVYSLAIWDKPEKKKKGKRADQLYFSTTTCAGRRACTFPNYTPESRPINQLSDLRYEDLAVGTAAKTFSSPRNTSSLSFADGSVEQSPTLDFVKSMVLECVGESDSQHPRTVGKNHGEKWAQARLVESIR